MNEIPNPEKIPFRNRLAGALGRFHTKCFFALENAGRKMPSKNAPEILGIRDSLETMNELDKKWEYFFGNPSRRKRPNEPNADDTLVKTAYFFLDAAYTAFFIPVGVADIFASKLKERLESKKQ